GSTFLEHPTIAANCVKRALDASLKISQSAVYFVYQWLCDLVQIDANIEILQRCFDHCKYLVGVEQIAVRYIEINPNLHTSNSYTQGEVSIKGTAEVQVGCTGLIIRKDLNEIDRAISFGIELGVNSSISQAKSYRFAARRDHKADVDREWIRRS
ncbi:hypothetical protein ACHAWO_006101, partial [Cyclotella atomus]